MFLVVCQIIFLPQRNTFYFNRMLNIQLFLNIYSIYEKYVKISAKCLHLINICHIFALSIFNF